MTDRFLIVVITSPEPVENEPEKITLLLKSGVDYVHIRKPGWTEDETRRLIADIPMNLRPRLRLHDHFGLAQELSLGGVHLNARNPEAPSDVVSVSRSCHSVEEVLCSGDCCYVTLSPIFDSISKHGYRSAFDLDKIKDMITGRHVIALGGVTPEAFPMLREKGFSGAALLGYIWNGDFGYALGTLAEASKKLKETCCNT
jgi:thiamine-phosphate pyrophosphorylase